MTEKNRIEAVLFTTGKFMSIEDIGKAAGIGSPGIVKEFVDKLKNEYDEKDSALAVQEVEGKYKLNIRKEYGHLANQLIGATELDSPTTKTLSVIAWKNPALQSDVIKIRGNKAYDHIAILREQGLVTAERYGRTRLLKLTPQFFDYFDTAEPQIREMLQAEVAKAKGSGSGKDYAPIIENIFNGITNTINNVKTKEDLLKMLETIAEGVKNDADIPSYLNNALSYLLEKEKDKARVLAMENPDLQEILDKMKEGMDEALEQQIEKEQPQNRPSETAESLKTSKE